MTQGSEQGTGKHPHKDTGEPWPHHESSGSEHEARSRSEESRNEQRSAQSSNEEKSEARDLKEREYRDEEGNVHHHTRTSEAMKDNDKKRAA